MTGSERTEAVAHLRFARMGPRKLRRVADAIRGKSVREALILLKFSGVFAAQPLERLLRSAVANAANNHNMDTDELYVTRVVVDGSPGGVQAQASLARDDRRRSRATQEASAQARRRVDRDEHAHDASSCDGGGSSEARPA